MAVKETTVSVAQMHFIFAEKYLTIETIDHKIPV